MFEQIAKKYSQYKNIAFWHKNLIGEDWEKALLDMDVIMIPYAAGRYRYHWSAMLFTAIGFYKPVLCSPEMNPEVLQNFFIGEAVKIDTIEVFSKQLEKFVNTFKDKSVEYQNGLIDANKKYGQDMLIKNILSLN